MIREENGHRTIMEGKVKQQGMSQTDISERMRQEELIQEKIDQEGNKWRKLYFGGGAHFRNWLSQCIEIYGEENIEIEDIDSTGFKCFEEGVEKMHRIWVKKEDAEQLID